MAMQAKHGYQGGGGDRTSWKATGLLCAEGSSREVAAELRPGAARAGAGEEASNHLEGVPYWPVGQGEAGEAGAGQAGLGRCVCIYICVRVYGV